MTCPFIQIVQSTGTLQITASQIICPKHYTPPKKKKIIHHVNTSWCFICSKGGALICCESCPASFHVDCLKIPDLNPEAKYFCDNCETGRMHLYGEVSYRIFNRELFSTVLKVHMLLWISVKEFFSHICGLKESQKFTKIF